MLPLMDLSTLTADYYSFSMPVINHKITNLTITHQNQNENKGCSRVTFAYSFHAIAMLSCCVSYYSITSVRGCLWVPHPQQIKLLQITCSVLLDHSLKILIDRISPPICHQSSYLLVSSQVNSSGPAIHHFAFCPAAPASFFLLHQEAKK